MSGLWPALAQNRGGEPIPAEVEVVTVDVVVLDKKGDPVTDLKQADFTVFEEGKPQTIAAFEAVGLPESEPSSPSSIRVSTNAARDQRPSTAFIVVFDDGNLTPVSAARAKPAILEFLQAGLQPGDAVTVIPTAGGAWWTTSVPQGTDDLVAFVSRLEGKRPPRAPARISDFEAMRLYVQRDAQTTREVLRRYHEHGLIADLPPPEAQSREELDLPGAVGAINIEAGSVYKDAVSRQRATLRGLERVLTGLAPTRGRKVVLMVSNGFIHDPTVDELRRVVAVSRRANAAVHFLDARGSLTDLGTSDAESARVVDTRDVHSFLSRDRREADGAESLAVDTGGSTVRNTDDLAGGMKRIARESRAYYLLGYQPADTRRDGKFRRIKVEVSRPGLEVRARRGYYAPSDKPIPKEPGDLDPAIRAAVDAPFDRSAIPLRLASYVFAPTTGGRSAVVLVAEADAKAFTFAEKNGRAEGQLDSFVLIAARDTGEHFHQERRIDLSLPPPVKAQLLQFGLPVLRNFELPPGTYQARLLLRDLKGSAVGTVRHRFEVPDTKRFRTSTPILTDALQPAPPGGGAPRPLPIARRTFASSRPLYYLFEVYGASPAADGNPSVTASYELKTRNGIVFSRMDPRPVTPGPGGTLSQVLSLSLEGAAPGEYLLVLTVKDELVSTAIEVSESFVVAGVAAPAE